MFTMSTTLNVDLKSFRYAHLSCLMYYLCKCVLHSNIIYCSKILERDMCSRGTGLQ